MFWTSNLSFSVISVKGIMIGETAPGGISQLKTHLQETEVNVDAVNNGAEGSGTGNAASATANAGSAIDDVCVKSAGENEENGGGAGAEGGGGEEEDDDDAPIDMSFPSGGGWKKIVIYLVSFPIMFPLYLTLPDTKDPKSKSCS